MSIRIHGITVGGITTVDSALSSESTNPVQNKVVTSALSAKQDTIDSDHKLPYSLLSGAPTIGSATITIMQGGVSKGSFSVNATENMSIALDAGGSAGNVSWGAISGTLANQTDLSSALAAKQDTIDSDHKLPYSNISDTPTIGSGVLSIINGGSSVTFGANQTSDTVMSIAGGGTAVVFHTTSGTSMDGYATASTTAWDAWKSASVYVPVYASSAVQPDMAAFVSNYGAVYAYNGSNYFLTPIPESSLWVSEFPLVGVTGDANGEYVYSSSVQPAWVHGNFHIVQDGADNPTWTMYEDDGVVWTPLASSPTGAEHPYGSGILEWTFTGGVEQPFYVGKYKISTEPETGDDKSYSRWTARTLYEIYRQGYWYFPADFLNACYLWGRKNAIQHPMMQGMHTIAPPMEVAGDLAARFDAVYIWKPVVSVYRLTVAMDTVNGTPLGLPVVDSQEGASFTGRTIVYIDLPSDVHPAIDPGITVVGTLVADSTNVCELLWDGTKAYLVVHNPAGGSAAVAWGDITGTLSSQADLSSALGAKQDVIDADHKLPYSNVSGTPTIGSAVITITQGGVSKGSFNVNATVDASIALDAGGVSSVAWGAISGTLANQTDLSSALAAKQDVIDADHKLPYSNISDTPTIPSVGSATITIMQGGVSKGSFNVNATENMSIALDAGGSAGNVAWGAITGTLADQADLSSALAAKVDSSLIGASNGVAPLDGSSLVPSGNLPVATSSTVGAVKVTATRGIQLNEAGQLVIVQAATSDIDSKSNSYLPITPKRIDYAVRAVSPNVTVIPAATDAYNLTDASATTNNHSYVYTHAPTSAPTYTLPAVTDTTIDHEIVITVDFTTVQTCVFHDSEGNTIAPMDEIVVSAGTVVCYLCRYVSALSCWCIVPTVMEDKTTRPPSLSISPSSYTVNGNQNSAITSLDLSSNVTVTNPTSGSVSFVGSNMPSGISISSAGVISGTPTAQGTTSATITISYPGATSITCTVQFVIAAPAIVYYYTVSGAPNLLKANYNEGGIDEDAGVNVNGNYSLYSGTHGTNTAIYTNGEFYLVRRTDTDTWGITHDPTGEWDVGPDFWALYYNGSTGDNTPTIGTYSQSNGGYNVGDWYYHSDSTGNVATVSAYSA